MQSFKKWWLLREKVWGCPLPDTTYLRVTSSFEKKLGGGTSAPRFRRLWWCNVCIPKTHFTCSLACDQSTTMCTVWAVSYTLIRVFNYSSMFIITQLTWLSSLKLHFNVRLNSIFFLNWCLRKRKRKETFLIFILNYSTRPEILMGLLHLIHIQPFKFNHEKIYHKRLFWRFEALKKTLKTSFLPYNTHVYLKSRSCILWSDKIR